MQVRLCCFVGVWVGWVCERLRQHRVFQQRYIDPKHTYHGSTFRTRTTCASLLNKNTLSFFMYVCVCTMQCIVLYTSYSYPIDSAFWCTMHSYIYFSLLFFSAPSSCFHCYFSSSFFFINKTSFSLTSLAISFAPSFLQRPILFWVFAFESEQLMFLSRSFAHVKSTPFVAPLILL